MVDVELLDAIDKLVANRLQPVCDRLDRIENRLERLEDVVEESLTLHDELEGHVKALEAKVI